MEKKIVNAINALYLSSTVTVLWSLFTFIELQQIGFGLEADPIISPFMSIRFAMGPMLISAATFFVAKELREKKKWAWLSAIALFVINSASIAIVFSIYGIIQLLDRQVRDHFFKAMDLDLG